MLDTVLGWDRAVFYWINHGWASPFLDPVFRVITDFDRWRILVVAGFLALAVFGRTKGRVTVLLVAVGILLSDQASAGLLKPLVARVRPCNALPDVRLIVPPSGAFSFPSSHAANLAGAALLLSVRYSRLWPAWTLVAFLVGLSRVYVGVHYPLDVLGGWAVGAAAALAVLAGQRLAVRALARGRARRTRSEHAP
jgi:undecaprenyl-diphosphatase